MKFAHSTFARVLGWTAVLSSSHAVDAQDAINPSEETDRYAELEEIIVTASKVGQSLRNMNSSLSVVSEDTLEDLNAQSLSDYITRVPGVVFNDYQPGVSEVVIRGVASTTYHEANQATTGYYLNEIPLVEPGFPLVIPDVDSFDLKRVEVLRGPQGTLFGSSSLGGAVNYVVNEADSGEFDASLETGASSTAGVSDKGYAFKGMVNLPLIEDKLAARFVGLQRFDAGYLDNTLLGEDGSNDLTVQGYRGSVVYTPSESTTVTWLSMYQEYNLDDQTYVIFNSDPETFERNTNVAEHQDTDFELHSLKVELELPFATLTTLVSQVEKSSDLAFDNSVFGGNDPRTGTPALASSFGESTADYFEVRLASIGDGSLQWQFGINNTKLESDATDATYIQGISDYIDANPGIFGGQAGNVLAPGDLSERTNNTNEVTEQAIFGEFTIGLSEVLALTVGGRYFDYETQPTLDFLPNASLISPFNFAPKEANESDFIPKIALTYEPEEFLVYVSYSEGFRLGGVNVYSLATPGLPLTFDSDSTSNLEVGTRFDLFDGQVTFDATIYHIEWDNIQARLFTPVEFRAYTTNGGGAEIDGVEITIDANLSDSVQINSSISYNDAELSEILPDSFAPGGGYSAGTQLPGASDLTLANTLDLYFDNLPLQPLVSLNHRYLSEAPVAFGATLEKGDFHIFDINASATLSEQLKISLFIKNIADEYGILNAPFSFAGSVVRPRTFGMSLRYGLK